MTHLTLNFENERKSEMMIFIAPNFENDKLKGVHI